MWEDVFVIDFENADVGVPETDFIHSYLMLRLSEGEEFAEYFSHGYGINNWGDLRPLDVAIGVLREISAAQWWEKNYDVDLSERQENIRNFLDVLDIQ
jgi:hypothetical protein